MQIGFFGALAVLFIALKLLNIITWSWLWVLAPIWLPIIAALSVWLLFAIGGFAVLMFARR